MPNTPLTLEQRIKELEHQLANSQQKAEFFESVVDVLERDYGVSIIEKPRGKSSGKSKKRGISIMQCCRYLGMTRQVYYKQCK